jgi:hypothetical protein
MTHRNLIAILLFSVVLVIGTVATFILVDNHLKSAVKEEKQQIESHLDKVLLNKQKILSIHDYNRDFTVVNLTDSLSGQQSIQEHIAAALGKKRAGADRDLIKSKPEGSRIKYFFDSQEGIKAEVVSRLGNDITRKYIYLNEVGIFDETFSLDFNNKGMNYPNKIILKDIYNRVLQDFTGITKTSLESESESVMNSILKINEDLKYTHYRSHPQELSELMKHKFVYNEIYICYFSEMDDPNSIYEIPEAIERQRNKLRAIFIALFSLLGITVAFVFRSHKS